MLYLNVICTLLVLPTCQSNLSFEGHWVLRVTSIENQVYEEISIADSTITVFRDGKYPIDYRYKLSERKLFLKNREVFFEIVDSKLNLYGKNGKKLSEYEKIAVDDCSISDESMMFRRFNYYTMTTNMNDRKAIRSLKQEMWEYFNSELLYLDSIDTIELHPSKK